MRSWLLVVAVAGCAQDRSPVRGAYSYRYPDGSTIPVDLSQVQFQAYVASDSGFSVYPASPVAGTRDGTFEIPDVPEGPILIRRAFPGTIGVFTAYDAHEVSETWEVLGRADAVPSSSSTRLRLDAMGLAAWHPGDRLLFDCLGNASEIANPGLKPALAAGDTAIHASLTWGNGYSWGPSGGAYLMDPAAGDALLVSRESMHVTDGIETYALTQTLDTAAPAQIDGQSAPVTGSFADVAQSARLTAMIRGDALADMLPAGTAPDQLGVSLVVGPATAHGQRLGPELAALHSSRGGEATTVTLHYGNPFDPAWPPLVTGTVTAIRTVHIPGRGDGPVTYPAFTEMRPLDGDSYTFQPLSPIGAIAIDDAPLGDVVTVPHGQSVRVDFAQPAEGTSGRLIVWEPETGQQVAYVAFDRAPVELPPDIFEDGGRYTLQIDVIADDGNGRVRTTGAYTDLFTIVGQ